MALKMKASLSPDDVLKALDWLDKQYQGVEDEKKLKASQVLVKNQEIELEIEINQDGSWGIAK